MDTSTWKLKKKNYIYKDDKWIVWPKLFIIFLKVNIYRVSVWINYFFEFDYDYKTISLGLTYRISKESEKVRRQKSEER